MSARLVVPENITLLPLAARSPELNPVENVWRFMRDNWLSNRVFRTYDDILDQYCESWNKLTEPPRVCRRLFGLSQATISSSLICA